MYGRTFTAALAFGLALAGTAHAAPFDISSGSYSIGTGYGCNTAGGTNTTDFFCATFATTIANPAVFNLNNVGDTQNFNFGTVVFNEDANNIVAGEADNLSVTAILNFLDPFAGAVQSIAAVGVFTGAINDGTVDYSLTFAPVVQAFGNGGQFTVDFSDLSWTGNDATARTQTVTITLNALPQVQEQPPVTAVPEPGTLALFGSALAGLALSRRRRTV